VRRIGVFVCHCGVNIAGTVDVKGVAAAASGFPGVAHAEDYVYMCSEPGQKLIRENAAAKGLEGIVVACCSPTMHETTFRKAAEASGMNPYLCEIANIREQCAWVHQGDKVAATAKAIQIVAATVGKLATDEPLAVGSLPAEKRILVIGGGVAGMSAALSVAQGGFEAVLVEREEELGGRAKDLSVSFPELLPAKALVAPLIARCKEHPLVTVLRGATVESVKGYVGNFEVEIGGPGGPRGFRCGAIVVATGSATYPRASLGEYGAGEVPDVVDLMAVERMLDPEGPTGGRILRPSDGKVPRSVVFVSCAGSRDPDRHMPYCSRICCMAIAKQAMLFRRQVPLGQPYVFYMDVRSDQKGCEEFVAQAQEEGVVYLRGRVARVFRENGKVRVVGADTLTGNAVEIAADLVVLATATVPDPGALDLAGRLHATADRHGFFTEAHIKLYPVESSTRGVLLAGTCQGPKDMGDSVAQALAAASKAMALLSTGSLPQDPLVATVDAEICSGCRVCVPACPYDARAYDPLLGVCTVNAALCQGCGACAGACPNKACILRNTTASQVLAMIDVFAGEGR
jgi:heterodisulfide reductase subunit A